MKALKKYFSGQSSGKGTLILYGRGSEGEEVMIDITEPKRINLKAIVAFIIILPVMMWLFSAIYGTESLNVTSENYFSKGRYVVFSSVLCGILLNWLIQAIVYIIINPRSYSKFAVIHNKRNHTIRFFYKGDVRIIHFRIANILAHCVCGYIPLLLGFIIGDISICYFGLLSIVFFFDETSLVWRLRRYSGQALCRYKSDRE
ncbi:hypothetical protein [Bacteroides caecigallinarum]|uniref:hypothetical protein n=1 Tax=Bacteroides caecigallinarum TaxID=1411144 RepID=UPI001F19911D|nr:hypothetical protein [Bacteroides caecigallinarum]MCF2580811.1 hypothetical protein [Bacteroides caecigallinarum]